MKQRPITVPGTRRQRVTTESGTELQRSNIYLPAETWQLLRQLSMATHRSGSQVVESLINDAVRGDQVKEPHDKRSSAANTGT